MSRSATLLRVKGWRGRGLNFFLGALAVLGHAPFHLWFVTVLCFAGLCLRLEFTHDDEKQKRTGFGTAFWFGAGYFLFGMYWIGSAFIARGPEFIPLIIPLVGGLIVLLSIIWGLAGALYAWARPRGFQIIIAFISFFFLAEFIRGHLFGGFPWNLPGYIFKAGEPMSQSASIFGVYGLTSIVLLISALLAFVFISKSRLIPGIVVCGIITGLFAFGAWRISGANIDYVSGSRLRIVQVEFQQKDKFDANKSVEIVNDFLTETMSPGLEDITHVIWPEGAVNGLALESPSLMQAMGQVLTSADDTPPIWLLNSLRHEQKPDPATGNAKDYYYNTSAAVRFDTPGYPEMAAYNDKKRLVPFGEFIPGGELIARYGPQSLSTALASMTPAQEKVISQFPDLPPVSPQICYEIIFSGLTPQNKDGAGPEWILNQSNDAWYGNSLGPRQHANIAQYRAIEEGLPVVRAAANGISGVIDPYGRFIVKSRMNETRVIDFNLPKPIGENSVSRNTNLGLLLIILLLSIQCLIVSRGAQRRGDNN